MRTRKKRSQGRILVGRLEISGYYRQLSLGLTSLGVHHDYVTFWPNPFGFGGENHEPRLIALSQRFPSFSQSQGMAGPKRLASALIHEFLISFWGLIAIARYDAFIFGFGETLLRRNLDLFLIHMLRKPVVVNMAHGSEARPPFLDGSALILDEEPELQARRLASLTRQTAKRVRRVERWATYVIGAPYSNSQFSRKPFINHFAIGIPYSQVESETSFSETRKRTSANSHLGPCILHSPSNPGVKGSMEIDRVMTVLSDLGFHFGYRVINGRPNIEVLEALQECDFVVDQLYSDTPLAGFATESAWMGRCSVVGGYALDELRSLVPEGMFPPSQICLPEELLETLKSLLENPETFKIRGQEVQRFVRDKWNAEAVAGRYLALLNNEVPDDWWTDPNSVCYVHGMGLSKAQLKSSVRTLVTYQGVSSLQLDHRPDLLAALLEGL